MYKVHVLLSESIPSETYISGTYLKFYLYKLQQTSNYDKMLLHTIIPL